MDRPRQCGVQWRCYDKEKLLPARRAREIGILIEPRLIILSILVQISLDPIEYETVEILLTDPFLQIQHRVDFAPVLAAFPDLNRRSTHLFSKINQFLVAGVASVVQKDRGVFRHQFVLNQQDGTICF